MSSNFSSLPMGKTFQTRKGVVELPIFVGIPIAVGLKFCPKSKLERLELIASSPELFRVWEFGVPLVKDGRKVR